MKITKTESIETVSILCDHCGEAIPYSGCQCIVCGKHACSTCGIKILRYLEIEGPRYYSLHSYQPDVPRVVACHGCESAITKGMAKLKEIMDVWLAAAGKCRGEYNEVGAKLVKQIERRERELAGSPPSPGEKGDRK